MPVNSDKILKKYVLWYIYKIKNFARILKDIGTPERWHVELTNEKNQVSQNYVEGSLIYKC